VQPAKTLWDWLQLLIVPAILIGVTFAWSATQTRNETSGKIDTSPRIELLPKKHAETRRSRPISTR
jgi:hypothetical protein